VPQLTACVPRLLCPLLAQLRVDALALLSELSQLSCESVLAAWEAFRTTYAEPVRFYTLVSVLRTPTESVLQVCEGG
jgi:hypothetical protein